ncbi:hypothetical protein SteCoe_33015 [Stentor coeruleus]|uniref:Uncharacterized protein n=1 Tax=Stentor coeruleus TaxID=5963 RepID=A0A1R2AXQ2_9CILI|nr:hypothetical protein SteCoe_33015 [Stentor coeruleus]
MGVCISKKKIGKLQKHLEDLKKEEANKKCILQTNTNSLAIPTYYSKILTKIVLRQPALQDLKQNKLYTSRIQINSSQGTTTQQNRMAIKENNI